jgi:hypothetical protein
MHLLVHDDGKQAVVATLGTVDFGGKGALGASPFEVTCVALGYQVVPVELEDDRFFDRVLASEGCIIEVRGYTEIPFASPTNSPLTRFANPVHRPRACSISGLLDSSAISRRAAASFIR